MSDFEVIDSGLIYDYFDSVSVYMHWHKEGKAMGRKSIRNLLTALLIVALIISPIRGLSGSAFRSYAATASEFDQLQKTFPVGTVLRSGMFPGLKVTFNGKDSIVVDENIGNVSISVTILDAELAAKEGIPILKNLFGLVKLPTKVGESVTTKVKLHSIGQAQYKNIVDNLDNEELSSLITQIFDPAVTAEQLDVLLEEFFDELSDAQDEQREAEQGQTEQSSGNGTASGQGTSGRGQAQGTSGNSQAQGQSQGGSGNSGTVAPPVPSVPEGLLFRSIMMMTSLIILTIMMAMTKRKSMTELLCCSLTFVTLKAMEKMVQRIFWIFCVPEYRRTPKSLLQQVAL